jgi:hypothetical protein
MVDGSWDNSGTPEKRKGLGTGLKIALGCGIAMLVILAGCAIAIGAGASWFGKQVQVREWPQLRQVVRDLGSDDGAAGVYRANPGLAEDYPSEEAFVKAARGWRPRLEPLPAEPPSVFTGRLSMTISVNNGRRSAQLGYRADSGATVSARWEDGRLAGLRVD